MKLSYYPGCSLQGTALDYDQSVREICAKLDIELVERGKIVFVFNQHFTIGQIDRLKRYVLVYFFYFHEFWRYLPVGSNPRHQPTALL